MTTDFVFNALERDLFAGYFSLSSSELSAAGAVLFSADKCPCYPCRVSLEDAEIGETVLAISYEHHPAHSAYRSAGPIFIRENADKTVPVKNSVPDMLRHRLLSVRGYNAAALMIEADAIAGTELESVLVSQFENPKVEYIHVHNAGPGCFNCSVTRAV